MLIPRRRASCREFYRVFWHSCWRLPFRQVFGRKRQVLLRTCHAEPPRTLAAQKFDQAIRVVSVNGEYNVSIGVVHRAKTSGKDAPSGIEHGQITEVYHVIEGNGTLVTGGTLENPREVPAESPVVKVLNGPSTGGTAIQGGVSRKLAPGDVVIIPPNTPHWFSEIATDQIVYLVVRVDPHKILPAGYTAK